MSEQQTNYDNDPAVKAYIEAQKAYVDAVFNSQNFQDRMLAFAEIQTHMLERIAVALERLQEAA